MRSCRRITELESFPPSALRKRALYDFGVAAVPLVGTLTIAPRNREIVRRFVLLRPRGNESVPKLLGSDTGNEATANDTGIGLVASEADAATGLLKTLQLPLIEDFACLHSERVRCGMHAR
jgi:hypothetical protein